MLPGVLLHVLEPPRPIDRPVNQTTLVFAGTNDSQFEYAFDDVENLSIITVHDIDHACGPELSSIEWLSA